MVGLRRFLMLGVLMAGLGACATLEPTTRDQPLSAGMSDIPSVATPAAVELRMVQAEVTVPEALTVSEANLYFPVADIVWRDDPLGDRHAQVAAIFDAAVQANLRAAQTAGASLVSVEVTLVRFHALTEKARYTIGGRHAIVFDLTFRDPKTGAALAPPRRVDASFAAFGGTRALEEEAKGNGQKERITAHLRDVFAQELSKPLIVTPNEV